MTSDDAASNSAIKFTNSVSAKPSAENLRDDHKISMSEPQGMFYKPGEDDSTDDSNVEEISRSLATSSDISINHDVLVFIKMTPYPITLENIIVSTTFPSLPFTSGVF